MKMFDPSGMRPFVRAAVLLSSAAVAAALAACSSGPGGGAGQGGDGPSMGNDGGIPASSPCRIVLTGGLTGTYACDPSDLPVAATFSSSDNATALFITANNGATDTTHPNILINVGFGGDAARGSFRNDSPGAQNGATITLDVATANGQLWTADAGKGVGTWTLSLGSAALVGSDAQGKAYAVHGVFEATCVQASGANVNLRAEF